MKPKTDGEAITDELSGIALDTVREVRSNKFLIPLFLGALCIAAAIFFVTSVLPLVKQATDLGQMTGEGSGQVAGWAVGSVEGATQGIPEGYQEGMEEGLSAKDTVAEIANTIESNVGGLGRLEVLVANVDLTTYHEIGKTYGALYLTRGSAVFTIDLSKATVTYREGLIAIVLPRPEVEITIDPTETELLADWQRRFFNGTDEQGYLAGLNTFKAIKNVSESQVANYTELLELASLSAIKQVEEIGNAARGNTDIVVTVSMQSN